MFLPLLYLAGTPLPPALVTSICPDPRPPPADPPPLDPPTDPPRTYCYMAGYCPLPSVPMPPVPAKGRAARTGCY